MSFPEARHEEQLLEALRFVDACGAALQPRPWGTLKKENTPPPHPSHHHPSTTPTCLSLHPIKLSAVLGLSVYTKLALPYSVTMFLVFFPALKTAARNKRIPAAHLNICTARAVYRVTYLVSLLHTELFTRFRHTQGMILLGI